MLRLKDPSKKIEFNGVKLDFEALQGERAIALLRKFPKLQGLFENVSSKYIIVKDGMVRFIANELPSVMMFDCVIADGQRLEDCHKDNVVIHPFHDFVPPPIGTNWKEYQNNKDRNNPDLANTNVFYERDPEGIVDGIYLKCYQIYFNESSRANCEPDYTLYENKNATPILENGVIEDVYLNKRAEWQEYDYVGIFSHTFRSKSKFTPATLKQAVAMRGKGFDLYGLSHKNFKNTIIKNDYRYHTATFITSKRKTESAWNFIFRRILVERMGWDEKVLDMPVMPIYFNHWLLKTSVYDRYYNELLKPVLEAMRDKEDEDLQKALFSDARYPKSQTIDKNILRNIFGREYYTFHPFVIERMISVWAAYKGINQYNLQKY